MGRFDGEVKRSGAAVLNLLSDVGQLHLEASLSGGLSSCKSSCFFLKKCKRGGTNVGLGFGLLSHWVHIDEARVLPQAWLQQ